MTFRTVRSMSDDGLELTASNGTTNVSAQIDLRCGGRVRQLTIEHNDERVQLLAPTAEVGEATATSWGSFPMAPWAGRLRHGRFTYENQAVALDLNHQDSSGVGGGRIDPPLPAPVGEVTEASAAWQQHAIHGTTFQRPWFVDQSASDQCEIHCPINTVGGWPFAGVARQSIRVEVDSIHFTLSIESASDASFPAALGWHPWFVKPSRLDAAPTSMYLRDAIGLPTGDLIAPPDGPWDDCFLNDEPVRLVYEREVAPIITVTSDCDHLVLFDAPDHATCVEPQSGPPDAPNVRREVVSPGSPLRRTMTWSW